MEPVSPSLLSDVSSRPATLSNVGWEDLPADAEDTFFLFPHEIEAYEMEKRRNDMERNREERMRAISALEPPSLVPEDTWGGSDEEVDEKQQVLMDRTASHIFSSPDPKMLEIRILANHGQDPRFAFLRPRGRWRRAWERAKAQASRPKPNIVSSAQALGGLAGYGDDDDDEDSSSSEADVVPAPEAKTQVSLTDDMAKRRERARIWSAQRKGS